MLNMDEQHSFSHIIPACASTGADLCKTRKKSRTKNNSAAKYKYGNKKKKHLKRLRFKQPKQQNKLRKKNHHKIPTKLL